MHPDRKLDPSLVGPVAAARRRTQASPARRARLLGLALLLAGLGTGCAEEELGADDFIARYPEAYCAYLWHCCDSAERSYTSKGTCISRIDEMVRELMAFREAATPYAEFLPDGAQNCLDTLAAKSCKTTLTGGCLSEATQALHKKDEECTYSAECSSYYCVQKQKNVRGYCGEQSVIGGNCSGDSRACPLGSYCNSYRVCQGQKDPGTTCSVPEECKSGVCSATDKICANPAKLPICDG